LFVAVENEHPEVVQILLDKGADPNVRVMPKQTDGLIFDENGVVAPRIKTPLSVAQEKGSIGIARILSEHGAKE